MLIFYTLSEYFVNLATTAAEGMTITLATPHAPIHVKKVVSSIVLPGLDEKLLFIKISLTDRE